MINILNIKFDHALAKIDPHAENVLVDQSMQSLENEENFINIKLKDMLPRDDLTDI